MNQLDEILSNIDEKQLKRLITKVKETHEYDVLSQKTQIKNSAVEDKVHDGHLTNRQTHTYQVSEVAYTMVKTSGMSEKEALVAKLVGLCHDLGHTPFGHDGENFFEEKTGKKFSHAKYGAKIFDKIFKEILSSKNPKTGKEIFDEETKENFESLRNYIKAGVNFHQDCYYMFELDKQLEATNSKDKELLEKAIQNPCIQAGMLADTVAFMQSDVRDMLLTKNPYDNSTTIITIEDEMQVASKIGFTKENIAKIQEEVFGQKLDMENLDTNTALRQTLEMLGATNVFQIQKMIAIQIGENGLNEKGRFESIPDEYKILADNNKAEYEKLIGKKVAPEEWENLTKKQLQEQHDLLREKNPLLCLTYEIQNQLMYNEIIYGDKIKLLNNDVERNKAIFSRVYDYLEKVTSTNSSELTVDDLSVKKQMMKIYKENNYPRQFEEKVNGQLSKKAIVKNLVIYKMQQMGNNELKDFYQEKLASKEKSLENEIDSLEQQGKSEDEMIAILQGMDVENYEEYKQKDENTKQKIQNLQDKTSEEISQELGIEKRDIDEIQKGKTTLSRNLEYNMTYQEIEQVTENLGKSELEEKPDMASFEWSQGEYFEVDMEVLMRNALAYMNITTEDVNRAESAEQTIRNQDKVLEGVNQR